MINTVRSVVLLVLIAFGGSAQAQTPALESLHVIRTEVSGVVKLFDTGTRTCIVDASKTYVMFPRSVVEFREVLPTGEYIIKVTIRIVSQDTKQVETGKLYCISKENFDAYFKPYSRFDYGALAIPFKGRFAPFQIGPGGTLGLYVGSSLKRLTYTLMPLASLGVSATAVNRPDSNNTDAKLGVTGAAGVVMILPGDFQLGGLIGIDLFEGVDTWVYKYQPWLSLSIGTTLINKK